MYKQFFRKSDGEVFLFNDEVDEISDDYTDVIPEDGLYQPIYFDGKKWIGTPYEIWLEAQPKVEIEEVADEKDMIIADLTVQLLSTQEEVDNLQKDIANLTLQILGDEANA